MRTLGRANLGIIAAMISIHRACLKRPFDPAGKRRAFDHMRNLGEWYVTTRTDESPCTSDGFCPTGLQKAGEMETIPTSSGALQGGF